MKELLDKIETWEAEHGESFNDYFSHDNIDPLEWALFLELKGLTEWANEIRTEVADYQKKIQMDYCNQDTMFEHYPLYTSYDPPVYSEENERKNNEILCEFLLMDEKYTKKLEDFFNEEDEEYE